MQKRPRIPIIQPLQRPLLRRLFQLLAGFMVLWLGAFLLLNDQRLGRLVTKVVSGQVRGQFRLGRAHYDYWSSLASVILNTAAPVRGGDFEMLDPDGNLVMQVHDVEAEMYIGELVRSLLRTAISVPFKRGVFIDLHFAVGKVHGGSAHVRPTASSLVLRPAYPEVNIVAAMSARRPSPPDSPGRLRIVCDGDGVAFHDVLFELGFPGWHARAEGLSGTATLRYSSAASETRPGRPSFVFEVSPIAGKGGELALGPEAHGDRFTFALSNIEMRHFGARASRPQDLVFRGRALVAGAPFEVDGRLLDAYCDPGVDLEMSFQEAGPLAAQVSEGMLFGRPRGRVRLHGPFSEQPPKGPLGQPAACLATRPSPHILGPDGRAVVIEGQVAGLEARAAGIHATEVRSQLRLARGVLSMPQVVASALGGQVRIEPLRISFAPPITWSGVLTAQAVDPAQVALLPRDLQQRLHGRLSGGARISGGISRSRGDRIRFAGIEASLMRQGREDALPRELEFSGDVSYSPALIVARDLKVAGEGLELSVPHGTVAPESGRVEAGRVELRAGQRASRLLAHMGIPASVREVEASLRLGGSVLGPVIEQGVLAAREVEIAGRQIEDIAGGFALKDGALTLSGVRARGLGGTMTGSGSMQIFRGDLRRLISDPPIDLTADFKALSAASLLGVPIAEGAVSSSIALAGTLRRPLGSIAVTAPSLLLLGSQLRDGILEAEFSPDELLMNSFYVAVGRNGALNGSAHVGRGGSMPLVLTLTPHRVQVRDLPGLNRLPFHVSGDISGALRIEGTTSPLRPVIDGQITIDGLGISGPPAAISTAPLLDPPEPQPLYRALGMVIRTLMLKRAELSFRPDGERTRFSGRLFEAFKVDGVAHLDPLNLSGELDVHFGCEPAQPERPASQGAVRVAQPCDLAVEKLIPELKQLGDIEFRTTGSLHLTFGRTLRVPFGAVPFSIDLLGSSYEIMASLRLARALLTIRSVDDDGIERIYHVVNDGEVVVASDGQTHEVRQARFHTERVTLSERSEHRIYGEVTLSGRLDKRESDLRIAGQLGLELIEQLVRGSFKHMRGNASVDVRVQGPLEHPTLRGAATLRDVRLFPHDMDASFDIVSGQIEMAPGSARLNNIVLQVEGSTTRLDGVVAVLDYVPLRLGELDCSLRGELSGRLLQWQLPRFLSEARGRLELHDIKLRGTPRDPRIDGTLVVRDLFLNVRRFHELEFRRGTVQLGSRNGDAPAAITIGCGTEQQPGTRCEVLSGTVDGDGRLSVSGRILHTGLGGFTGPLWNQALQRVHVNIALTNVRHSAAGVYNVEVSSPRLVLLGDRSHMTLSGSVNLVSGRYVQPFELKERFLARRVLEEEAPFWHGDPFLSDLEIDLVVFTRGTFQVLNNIADLRLSTAGFVLTGPLSRMRMGGTIRVDSGTFYVPGLRGEFSVRGDSKIEFSEKLSWPDETPWVDIRGSNVQFDRNDQQRNVELALRGKVSELKIECLSSDGLNANDCASYLVMGGTTDQLRSSFSGDLYGTSPRALAYGDNAARLLSGQLLMQQVEDPLRQKLRLDTVRIQFGVSSFDVQLCKRFGLYLRTCGLAEWGLLGATSARYRAYGELQLSDWAVGQVSFDHLERGFDLIQDTINRFRFQLGLRRSLRF